jgi:hypothetical protein
MSLHPSTPDAAFDNLESSDLTISNPSGIMYNIFHCLLSKTSALVAPIVYVRKTRSKNRFDQHQSRVTTDATPKHR